MGGKETESGISINSFSFVKTQFVKNARKCLMKGFSEIRNE